MKKTNKVYSASDFVNANSAVVVENCWWSIDSIDFTKVGEYSKSPLFELQLKRIVTKDPDVPEGYDDSSIELEPNRTYFVREGRPLYTALAEIWEAVDDADVVRECVRQKYANKAFRGHVERLSGISYTTSTKRGNVVQRSRFECWYPESYDEGRIFDDFIYLCNRGVYTPVVEEKKPVDPMADVISKLDPKIIEAILASKK